MAFLRDKKALHIFVVLFIFFLPVIIEAQSEFGGEAQKVYEYQNIDVTYTIQSNSTVRVEEQQTYNFVSGEFHQGWREIPKNKIDGISDVLVVDANSGEQYAYSRSRLTKTDPASWGKYTVFNQDGKSIIEWYYNTQEKLHTWKLQYTIHGALGFFDDADELYINVFDSYNVPVRLANVRIILPEGAHSIHSDAFRSDGNITINKELRDIFSSLAFAPNEAFTVQISWPRGFVDRNQYILSFLKFHYGVIGSIVLVVLSILISIIYFVLRRKQDTQFRGTIVPEYEPPKNYRPLFAEIATRGYISDKGLSATIVDLAVRGYVAIEEDSKPSVLDIFRKIKTKNKASTKVSTTYQKIFILLLICGFLAFVSIMLSIIVFTICIVFSGIIFGLSQKDYVLKKQKDFTNDPTLEDFERTYLEILFESSDTFSTRELRSYKSNAEKQKIHSDIENLKLDAISEIEGDTKAYIRPISGSRKFLLIGTIVFFVCVFAFQFLNTILNGQIVWLLVGGCVSIFLLLWMFRFRPLLSEEGKKLREEWLGFKMYLETAEKYRLQNLTPETFERFLPYAMVFKLEKKWARAFEEMNVPQPNWYHGAIVGSGVASTMGNSFSPAAFSSSFSSSFSSAFSSSAGSSGGGGAGGGGGGGGGGAS